MPARCLGSVSYTHLDVYKRQAENYIIERFAPEALGNLYHAFGDSSIYPGKQVYIMRPCMIHGPGNKGNLNLLYNVVSKGIPWPLGAFENRRSFTSVQNLCTCLLYTSSCFLFDSLYVFYLFWIDIIFFLCWQIDES